MMTSKPLRESRRDSMSRFISLSSTSRIFGIGVPHARRPLSDGAARAARCGDHRQRRAELADRLRALAQHQHGPLGEEGALFVGQHLGGQHDDRHVDQFVILRGSLPGMRSRPSPASSGRAGQGGSGLLSSQSRAARPLTACAVLSPAPSSVAAHDARTSASSSTISTSAAPGCAGESLRSSATSRARSIGLVMNSEAPSE